MNLSKTLILFILIVGVVFNLWSLGEFCLPGPLCENEVHWLCEDVCSFYGSECAGVFHYSSWCCNWSGYTCCSQYYYICSNGMKRGYICEEYNNWCNPWV